MYFTTFRFRSWYPQQYTSKYIHSVRHKWAITTVGYRDQKKMNKRAIAAVALDALTIHDDMSLYQGYYCTLSRNVIKRASRAVCHRNKTVLKRAIAAVTICTVAMQITWAITAVIVDIVTVNTTQRAFTTVGLNRSCCKRFFFMYSHCVTVFIRQHCRDRRLTQPSNIHAKFITYLTSHSINRRSSRRPTRRLC